MEFKQSAAAKVFCIPELMSLIYLSIIEASCLCQKDFAVQCNIKQTKSNRLKIKKIILVKDLRKGNY